MTNYDPKDIVRECVSCKRCYPSSASICRDCLIELKAIEVIPYIIASQYMLERVLNYGSMGIVFGAKRLTDESSVVLKVIRSSALADPRAYDRFHHEVDIAINFDHPMTARTLDFGMLPDAGAYVVNEYIKGRSLRDEINAIQKFEVRAAVKIITELCDVLDAAHSVGLVHRDLKPESVIILDDNELVSVKLVDFTLARISSGQHFVPGSTSRLQMRGHLPLRPSYISPEQFKGEDADLRSDIFSLGVISYEMLTGKLPFSGNSTVDFGNNLLSARPANISILNPDIEIAISAVVMWALEKEPLKRPQRLADFKRRLLNAMHFS